MEKSLRVAVTGSSITWGDGLLDDSYVTSVDKFLRDNYADTLNWNQLSYHGRIEELRNPRFYLGAAARLQGEGSEASFELEGETLSLCIGIECTGAGACIAEVYDGESLIGSFDTQSPAPARKKRARFTGDGKSNIFHLGECFTFGHQVTKNGAPLKGRLHTGGYGGVFDTALDYMVIRKYQINSDGQYSVTHALWFLKPPEKGTDILAEYQAGENILYTKGSIGETLGCVDSPLESPYGCEETGMEFSSGDISCGLDFRCTDPRSIRTFRLKGRKKRRFRIRLKKSGPQEPALILNFVTNRCHSIMNAGIGGWTAEKLLRHPGLNSYREILKFLPDIVCIEEGTNDDWKDARFAAHQLKKLEKDQLLERPVFWLKECVPEADGYAVKDCEIQVAEAGRDFVRFSKENTVFEEVKPGDVAALGSYYGDNRNLEFHRICRWDRQTATAYFKEPVERTKITKGFIKAFDGYERNMRRLIDIFQRQKIKVGLVGTGLSNFYTRPLFGYREKIMQIAADARCGFADVYPALLNWQYSRPKELECRLRKISETKFALLAENGTDINQWAGLCGLRNFSVFCEGEDLLAEGKCRIEGGYGYFYREDAEKEEMSIRENNQSPGADWRYRQTKLVLNEPVPPEKLRVTVSGVKWSADDCHMVEVPHGAIVYGEAVCGMLSNLIKGERV